MPGEFAIETGGLGSSDPTRVFTRNAQKAHLGPQPFVKGPSGRGVRGCLCPMGEGVWVRGGLFLPFPCRWGMGALGCFSGVPRNTASCPLCVCCVRRVLYDIHLDTYTAPLLAPLFVCRCSVCVGVCLCVSFTPLFVHCLGRVLCALLIYSYTGPVLAHVFGG